MTEIKLYHKEPLSIDLIEETFKASFNVNFNREYWIWRFLNNPNSDKTYIAYIVDDGVLAAYYAVSPMKISINGIVENLALSNMTMTHPNYRGRGYFKILAKKLYDNLKEEGFIGVYGFANHNSHYGFRKYLNWFDISALNLFSAVKEEFKSPLSKDEINFSIEPISDKNIDTIVDLKFNGEGSVHIIRDYKNLKWRLKDNPSNQYFVLKGTINSQVEIVLVYKSYGSEIDIMEVFYYSLDENFNLLIQSFSYLFGIGERKINLWSNLKTNEHVVLEKYGFKETNFNNYFGIIPFTENGIILEHKNWHYRFIDSDIF